MAEPSAARAVWHFIRAHWLWGVAVFFFSLIPVFSPRVSIHLTWVVTLGCVLAVAGIGYSALRRAESWRHRIGFSALSLVIMAAVMSFGYWSTLGTSRATPLPLKKITIASQEDVNPAEGDPPYATEVTLHTTADIHPTWVVLRCDEPITEIYCYVNLGTPLITLTSCGHVYAADRKTVWFHFQQPTFSPKTPLVVTLKGNTKMTAESVDEQRPPAGLPDEGSSGGNCIRRRPASLDAKP